MAAAVTLGIKGRGMLPYYCWEGCDITVQLVCMAAAVTLGIKGRGMLPYYCWERHVTILLLGETCYILLLGETC
jgi:hypothetical protein